MLNYLIIFLTDLRFIFLKERGIKRPLLLFVTNLRLKFKQLFLKLLGIRLTREKFLGLDVEFSDYEWFCHLWREIFIIENYYFETSKNKPVIFDVGGNIGMSVCYFKILYPDSEIVAFEPDPQAFKLLERNVRVNKFSGVTIHNVALGSRKEKVDFYQDLALGASGINTLYSDMAAGKNKKVIKVEADKLSSFANKEIDLLKIDVEGSEYEIFKEFSEKLRLVKLIILELHQGVGSTNADIPELLKILDRNGFRYAITQAFLSHHSFAADFTQPYALMLSAMQAGSD